MYNPETKQPQNTERENIKTLFEFKENNLDGKWLVLNDQSGSRVEGALYSPESIKNNHELVAFFPGLPGDGVVWFEEKHLPQLLEQGYNVFSCRHKGLRYDKKNELYVHNSERVKLGNIDNKPTEVDDWLNEPRIIMENFANLPEIASIDLVTHSFSGLSAATSLIELQKKSQTGEKNPLHKIKKWLILSGFMSNLREQGFWDPNRQSLTLDLFKDFFKDIKEKNLYNLTDPEKSTEQLKAAFANMKSELKTIPENIGVTGVYPEADQTISINAGLDLQENLGRGVIIDDKTFRQERFTPETNAHDFPHLAPQTLIRLLEMRGSKYKHIFPVRRPDTIKK